MKIIEGDPPPLEDGQLEIIAFGYVLRIDLGQLIMQTKIVFKELGPIFFIPIVLAWLIGILCSWLKDK